VLNCQNPPTLVGESEWGEEEDILLEINESDIVKRRSREQ